MNHLSGVRETHFQMTSWIQLLVEFQRDWTRHETYEAAGAVVVANGGIRALLENQPTTSRILQVSRVCLSQPFECS